ncbi:hypothetical protein F2Q69_00047917 [Brassica cretica]|uniref:Uncharacterized protein n=1 Tax=Brassica cretica TaxID=69181 RepID=A0A8S9PV60_BRACR|nr:hypothetical protein F2Q69_00047917 [Brassica cretica]
MGKSGSNPWSINERDGDDPARHMASGTEMIQLAIWRAGLGRTSSPYGERRFKKDEVLNGRQHSQVLIFNLQNFFSVDSLINVCGQFSNHVVAIPTASDLS